jgi:type II secretory ATPase GspE/PulE/Tfp pilus assembly ATPase PilB-like protein
VPFLWALSAIPEKHQGDPITMSTPYRAGEMARRLAFFRALQAVTQRIQATTQLDESLPELSQALCDLFEAQHLIIYQRAPDGSDALIAQIRSGEAEYTTLRLPIDTTTIAGYVAAHRKTLNLANVHDAQALQQIAPDLRFSAELEALTGSAIRQMLAAPMMIPKNMNPQGVILLINSRQDQPFSAFAEEGVLGMAQTLGVALEKWGKPVAVPRTRYEALVIDGVLSSNELKATIKEARQAGGSVEALLSQRFGLTPVQLGEASARFYRLPYEPFRPDRIKPMDLLKNLKRDFAEQSLWAPLEEGPEGIVIMAVDPEQVKAARVAHNVFPKARLTFRVTTRQDFRKTVDQIFENTHDEGNMDALLSGMDEGSQESNPNDDVSAAADNELVKLVNRIITEAHRLNVSDIHIEPRPGKEKTQIRFRKDGSLLNYIEVPAAYRNPLVTRIKIMCDLDISERRKPQDGKIKFRRFAPLDIELRVATIPTAGGMEDVVMRLLANSEPIPLDKIGLSTNNLARLRSAISKPYGLFFVAGPTGSGKTTTLHSILSFLNTPETKIWTAEDPVEITQKGLRQVQVNRKAGLDFAVMMRAFLRADPDVIMVGEMRDKETVSTGIEASLTGHLVLSTLHTNSAPESVIRLLDMGMDPFNFSDALLGILAQRLAKRLCSACKEAYEPSPDELERLLDEYCADLLETPNFVADPKAARMEVFSHWQKHFANDEGRLILYHPKGCPECNKGYRGRLGLHELMIGTDPIKHLIQEKARVSRLLSEALAEGMRTLRQDGIEKVLQGFTDMAQVRKVCVR